MLFIHESNRNYPAGFQCAECGNGVNMVIHHDFIEGRCCDKTYTIPVDGSTVWNCCSVGINTKEGSIQRWEQVQKELQTLVAGITKTNTASE